MRTELAERRQVYHKPETVPSDQTLEKFGLRRKPRLVVEVGFGETPIPLNGNLQFGEYAGFDAANGDGYEARTGHHSYSYVIRQKIAQFKELLKERRPGEKIRLEEGDAVKDETQGRKGLDSIRDGAATEVYLGDVLNAPFDNGDEERLAILAEAQRMLNPYGRLVVKVSWGRDALGEFQLDRINHLLRESGFSTVDHCIYGATDYNGLEERYGKTPIKRIVPVITGEDEYEYSAYYVVAKKGDPAEEGSLT